MPGLLRDLAVGRSWRSRLARGATVLALGGAWVAPTFGLCPPLALYNTTESVAPGLYLYAHDARSVAPTRGDYYCCVTGWPNSLILLNNSGRVPWPEKAVKSMV